MPNNLQILAYIQSMKDHLTATIEHCKMIESHNGKTNGLFVHKAHLVDVCNLEKFIKGGN